jgi:hypothetical protein
MRIAAPSSGNAKIIAPAVKAMNIAPVTGDHSKLPIKMPAPYATKVANPIRVRLT